MTALPPAPQTEPYERFLTLQNDTGHGFRSQLLDLLITKSVVPGFSATTMQLIEAAQDENTSVDAFSRIVSLDPALTLRCIKAATTIGAAVASAMGAHPRVLNGIMFHHRPLARESTQAPMAERGFIAACVGLANGVAKYCEAGFHCTEEVVAIEALEEWRDLGQFDAISPLDIDVGEERDLAEQDLKALLGGM